MHEYRLFAERQAKGHSPVYEALSVAVAGDERLLALLHTLPPVKRQPNLLLAAARRLGAPFDSASEFLTWVVTCWDEVSSLMLARAASGIGATPLQRALGLLTDKRIVAAELPVSLRPSKDRRYRVADPYLRFWLKLLGPSMEEIERGRGDLVLERVRNSWASWRGRAVEPVIREALARLLTGFPRPLSWAGTGPVPMLS